nr:hypothetical protein [uncultured Dubosiella sp.]
MLDRLAGRFHKIVEKQVQMANRGETGIVHMMQNVLDFLHHRLFSFGVSRPVNRIVHRDVHQIQRRLHAQAVEFDPRVFPRILLVGEIRRNLARINQKPLSGVQMERLVLSCPVGRDQRSLAAVYVMKQVMVAGGRAENVGRRALLASALIQSQVDVVLVGKNIKDHITHICKPFPRYISKCYLGFSITQKHRFLVYFMSLYSIL